VQQEHKDHKVFKVLWDFKDDKASKVLLVLKDLKVSQFLVSKVLKEFKDL
jgi:hypothetical protein